MAFDFAAGCLGGCAGVMVGYPLDTVKVHIQTQDFRNPKYTGTWHCFRTILARDSVAGLYRGMSSPMAGVAVVNAIIFGIYGNTQRQLSQPDSLFSHFVAGAVAGTAQSPVCSPMELAKTRLQLQNNTGVQFRGPVECLRYIYRKEGLRGVFKGLGITVLREAPGYGTYFMTYEALTRSTSPEPISTFAMLMAGGLAGTASWIFTYPIDVIKSRLQAEATGRYSGALDCMRQLIRSEGYTCLFRGLNSTIIRAFPTNAATFTVVTWAFRLFGNSPEGASETPEKPIVVPEPLRVPRNESDSFVKWNNFFNHIVDKVHPTSFYSALTSANFDGAADGRSLLKLRFDVAEVKVKPERENGQNFSGNSHAFDLDVPEASIGEENDNHRILEQTNESPLNPVVTNELSIEADQSNVTSARQKENS